MRKHTCILIPLAKMKSLKISKNYRSRMYLMVSKKTYKNQTSLESDQKKSDRCRKKKIKKKLSIKIIRSIWNWCLTIIVGWAMLLAMILLLNRSSTRLMWWLLINSWSFVRNLELLNSIQSIEAIFFSFLEKMLNSTNRWTLNSFW